MNWPEEKFDAFAAGALHDAWTILGAHPQEGGTAFAVWAPSAHRVAVTAVARKLCHVVFAIMRDQVPYSPGR